ncbi:MAG: 2-dehydropantoate 2-reductase, partial [Rubrivivax sp.]|nr:2-dehydropantoate 2-reductase [Rubrivivax sp.]
QNGLGNVEQLARLFPPEQIFGGLCFVCLNRIAPGVIRHTDHGHIVLGQFAGPPGARARELAAMFRQAGVPCELAANLAQAHWEKLTWNIPFNGLGVAGVAGYEAVVRGRLAPDQPLGPVLSTDRLLDGGRWEGLVRELILEVVTAARTLGLKLPEGLVEQQIARTRTMGAYKASTLLDFEQGRPLELEALFLEPLRRATQAGASVPRLAALSSLLSQLQARRQS